MIWYNCTFYDSGSISDWDIFFVFDSFQIVSARRFRNACARLIFIQLFINRVSHYSFFFSYFFYINWCMQMRKWLLSCITRMTPLVYYEALVRWLYVDSESFIKIWYPRSAYDMFVLQQYLSRIFVFFCDSSIDVYC